MLVKSDSYCIDASALIDLRILYPVDVFPKLWDNLEAIVKGSRLISPDEVYNELAKVDDDAFKWLKKFKKFVVKSCQASHLKHVAQITKKFPSLVKPKSATPVADPFVVALAIEEHKAAGPSCCVVTQESQNLAKVRIPKVCDDYGVPYADVLGWFRGEGWKF